MNAFRRDPPERQPDVALWDPGSQLKTPDGAPQPICSLIDNFRMEVAHDLTSLCGT